MGHQLKRIDEIYLLYFWNLPITLLHQFENVVVGGKDLNCYVGPQAPITNKSMSEEDKMFGKAP